MFVLYREDFGFVQRVPFADGEVRYTDDVYVARSYHRQGQAIELANELMNRGITVEVFGCRMEVDPEYDHPVYSAGIHTASYKQEWVINTALATRWHAMSGADAEKCTTEVYRKYMSALDFVRQHNKYAKADAEASTSVRRYKGSRG